MACWAARVTLKLILEAGAREITALIIKLLFNLVFGRED